MACAAAIGAEAVEAFGEGTDRGATLMRTYGRAEQRAIIREAIHDRVHVADAQRTSVASE